MSLESIEAESFNTAPYNMGPIPVVVHGEDVYVDRVDEGIRQGVMYGFEDTRETRLAYKYQKEGTYEDLEGRAVAANKLHNETQQDAIKVCEVTIANAASQKYQENEATDQKHDSQIDKFTNRRDAEQQSATTEHQETVDAAEAKRDEKIRQAWAEYNASESAADERRDGRYADNASLFESSVAAADHRQRTEHEISQQQFDDIEAEAKRERDSRLVASEALRVKTLIDIDALSTVSEQYYKIVHTANERLNDAIGDTSTNHKQIVSDINRLTSELSTTFALAKDLEARELNARQFAEQEQKVAVTKGRLQEHYIDRLEQMYAEQEAVSAEKEAIKARKAAEDEAIRAQNIDKEVDRLMGINAESQAEQTMVELADQVYEFEGDAMVLKRIEILDEQMHQAEEKIKTAHDQIDAASMASRNHETNASQYEQDAIALADDLARTLNTIEDIQGTLNTLEQDRCNLLDEVKTIVAEAGMIKELTREVVDDMDVVNLPDVLVKWGIVEEELADEAEDVEEAEVDSIVALPEGLIDAEFDDKFDEGEEWQTQAPSPFDAHSGTVAHAFGEIASIVAPAEDNGAGSNRSVSQSGFIQSGAAAKLTPNRQV